MPSPSASRHVRPMSPPPSTSSQAFTIGQQQKLNVVTRLAIEGKAKQGQDGASIKMYLKVSAEKLSSCLLRCADGGCFDLSRSHCH